MAFHFKQLVICLCVILLLLSTISLTIFFSHAKENPCTCQGSDQDRSTYIMKDVDAVFLVDEESGLVRMPLHKLRTAHPSKTRVLSTIDRLIQLCQRRPDGSGIDESSFNVTIAVRNRRTHLKDKVFSLLILPDEALNFHKVNDSLPLAKQLVANNGEFPLNLSNHTYRDANRRVHMEIGVLEGNPARTGYDNGERVVGVDIIIRRTTSNYSVWIDYDRVGKLSVYVDLEGKPKPAIPIAEAPLIISSVISVTSPFIYFGLLATVGQRRHMSDIHFSATVDNLPDYPAKAKGGFLSTSKKVTILSSILGSVAATTLIAMVAACYFNSRYRRWHRELDKLARFMERLPGVPTKVDFADIHKATGNFHEAMKLGRGGFGTVYRCTLPAAASKTKRPMDVAVKRFTRDVQTHRYDDFLAEVSIINRLRHKNIVPLVGWSYNKGEPLLVFEYMTNGSLDQHLFTKRGGGGCSDATIHQWATRYEIIRGVATGLHYVHHEYEPMVLHRDIKASNVMLDSSFRARLGDFGLACTVATDRKSATGVGGTWGYIAPEYAMRSKTTRQTDIYALGVLILEVVTGQRALADHLKVVDDDDVHITDRVWRLHHEGRLSECVDSSVLAAGSEDGREQMDTRDDAARLLLLGLACSNPNPSDRPTMPEVVQIIAKSALPPDVPLQKPRFVWPPPEEWASDDDSTSTSMMSEHGWSTDTSRSLEEMPRFNYNTSGVVYGETPTI